MSAPAPVKVSFWILLISIVLSVVIGVLAITSGSLLNSTGERVGPGPGLSGSVLIGFGIIAIVFSLIELLFLWKMKAGKNWARITVTILELLGLVGLFDGVDLADLFAVALTVVAIGLLWTPSSNQYFRKA